jgi:hypothetical protein
MSLVLALREPKQPIRHLLEGDKASERHADTEALVPRRAQPAAAQQG